MQPAPTRRTSPAEDAKEPKDAGTQNELHKRTNTRTIHTPVTAFENKAGRYELIRVDDDQVVYSFTNRDGKTTDSVMPLMMWHDIASRAIRGESCGTS
jgi:hypothetical protein